MSDYEALARDYYAKEESILLDAYERLKAAGASSEAREALKAAVSQVRSWAFESLQAQSQHYGELETALRETRNALLTAQERMEGIERENKEAAAVLFRLQSAGGTQAATAGPALELQRKLEEQEVLLRRRDAELLALRKQFEQSQAEMDALVRRLELQEEVLLAPISIEPAPVAAADTRELDDLREAREEVRRLQASLREAQESQRLLGEEARTFKERLSEEAALRGDLESRIRELESRPAPNAPSEDIENLRRRLAEMESQLAKRDPGAEALRVELAQANVFREGLMQRIRALEGARAKAAEAKPVPGNAAVDEKRAEAKWKIDKEEMEERMLVLQQSLANLQRTHENSERNWIETMTRQDTARLQQISDLKDEVERLKGKR